MQWLISLLGGGVLTTITKQLSEAYQSKLDAETDAKKLEADIVINQLEAQRSLLIAEQGKMLTSWIRPALAFPVVAFVWKIVLIDTVLKMGTTPYPGELVQWIVVTTIGAYMITRPFERK
jgi:hypothetical protein